ncbi:MAG: hypothetical protein JWR12_2979 [Mucilaginibacter sp.]|nr:hypothetical protein [Mucilaginibacter sp.]
MEYEFLPELFLRAPYYSFARYDMDRLSQVLGDWAFRNALFLASPAFYSMLERKEFDFELLNEKEKYTLYKYYNRMCFRPVPFGSFASFSLLEWGEGSAVKLAGKERAVLHLLPDMGLFAGSGILRDEDLLVRNPTLYRVGREFRFVKSLPDENGHYRFSLEALAAEQLNIALVAQVKKKNPAAGALKEWIRQRTGCSAAAAAEYLDFLVSGQILLWQGTGGVIRDGHNTPEIAIPGWSEFWSAWQHRPWPAVNLLSAAAGQLKQLLPVDAARKSGQYFYGALERKAGGGGPGEPDKTALLAAIKVLQRFSIPATPVSLQQFAADFSERFDLEKVPLLLALDPDTGMGYGNLSAGEHPEGVLDDIPFPQAEAATERLEWTRLHRWLFGLMAAARSQAPYHPVIIREEDLEEPGLPDQKAFRPSTLYIMFRKTADHLLLEQVGSTSGTSVIGRFSAFDEEVLSLCRKLAQQEALAHPELVFADIGQLSDLHTDNINRRQRIYEYEIPVNVYSAIGEEAQLTPDDLLVSVRDGELVLESMRLGKRVIPRLATAYNYHHNELAVFRLLCDLQYQGLHAPVMLSLERFFPGLDFYPRVVFEQTILSLAKWHLDEAALNLLLKDNAGTQQQRIRLFRNRLGLPQWVSLGNNDQQLVFDLGDEPQGGFFINCLRGLKSATLLEYIIPDRSVKTGYKPLAGQFIAFLFHKERSYREITTDKRPEKTKEQRYFLLGTAWLYLKLYCTPESADRILAKVIVPFLKKNRQHIACWFFIRYSYKGHHLRLRFRTDAMPPGQLLAELNSWLKKDGYDRLVKDYTADSYRREMERYSGDLIRMTEEVFCRGSKLVCRFLTLKESGCTELTEFQLGAWTAFGMIACFLTGAAAFTDFTELIMAGFWKEFKGNKALKTALDRKYRLLREELSQLLDGSGKKGILQKTLNPLLQELISGTERVRTAARDLTGTRKSALLADLVHMQMNRTFRTAPRQQEFLVYYCLNKYTLSLIARKKKEHHPGGSA